MSETPEVSETPEEPGAPSVRAEGWLPAPAIELFGAGASAVEEYALLTVDVPAERWLAALLLVRDELGCDYFDWLSAVDEPGTGFLVCAHLVALPTAHTTTAERRTLRRLVVRTVVPHDAAELPTATEVYAGAAWHERETYEMFGVRFPGHPGLDPLLLPDGFEGHPLRKDFVLAARVAKAWPGAKEPGESHDGGPRRRQMLPPGVPDPNEWGPLKGQLPAAPARGRARGAERTAAAERPRRNRGASQGSASQVAADTQTTDTQTPASGTAPAARPARPRRSRSASEGSASQRATPRDDQPPAGQPTSAQGAGGDAPWHHARPAFEENADERDSTARPAVPEDAPTEAPTEDEQRGRTEDEG